MSHLIACPECNKHLQVPENLLGKKVQCPECKHAFTAALPDADVAVASKPAPPQPPAWEEKRRAADDEEERDRPRKRRRDEDEDDDDLPRRPRRARLTPHRGGMILAFGIIGLVGGSMIGIPVVFGLLAWIMGNNDLREMRAGRMDPEGETMTNVGRILGIITTVLTVVAILGTCVFFCFIFGIAGLAANKGQQF